MGDDELTRHFIPLDVSLRDASAFSQFLEARRGLLADAMNDFLDNRRPSSVPAPLVETSPTATATLRATLFSSAWDLGRVRFDAAVNGSRWSGSVGMEDLQQAIENAERLGTDSDIEIAGESVPVHAGDDNLELAIGPFLVSGTLEEWKAMLNRELDAAHSLSDYLQAAEMPWTGDRVAFSVASTD